jgi:hypothetical protein
MVYTGTLLEWIRVKSKLSFTPTHSKTWIEVDMSASKQCLRMCLVELQILVEASWIQIIFRNISLMN